MRKTRKTFSKGQMVSSGTFVLPPKLTAGEWEVKFDHGLGNVVVNAKGNRPGNRKNRKEEAQ